MSRLLKWLIGTLASVSALMVTLWGLAAGYFAYEYPYGASHCCDLALADALILYAERHDDWFPRGESTPEASLSLLHRETLASADLLRGKSVPLPIVEARLVCGELLTPDSCEWHYVEGLRRDDDPRLGLFWDKAGLSHNGGRLPGGGHTVIFVNRDRKQIRAENWQNFLAEQQRLLAERASAKSESKTRGSTVE